MRRRRRRGGPLAVLLVLALSLVGAAGGAGLGSAAAAGFKGAAAASLSVGSLDLSLFAPASVSASRLDASTCRVSWTASAAANPPSGLKYDVGDGTTTLASNVSGLTVDLATSAGITPQVKAHLGLWTSATATASSGPCGTVPGAPTGVALTPGNAQLAVSWTAPASNGGSTITGYTATTSPGGFTCTSASSPCTITGLTNGTAYTVTVKATSAIGTGPASGSATGTPSTIPGAPTGVGLTPGNTQLAVSWTAPASTGGSAITQYTAITSPGGLTCTSASSPCTITGLTNGTAYTVTVTATNANGAGPASSSATGTPSTIPGAPTGVALTPGNAQLAVSWTAPASNGGSAITQYTATATGGAGGTCTSASSPCTITGLTNGTSYTVTVTATNANGAGPASSSATGTPVAAPGAPTALALTPGDSQVAVSWTAPASTGGSAITGYTATATGGSTCTSATTSCTITGLTNGSTYSVTVTATNSTGTGSPSSAASAIPYPVAVMSGTAFTEWLDAADLTTLSQDSAGSTPVTAAGQSVGRWVDKATAATSPNTATQATSGARPSTTTVAGRVVPTFDGSSQYLSLTASKLPGGTSASTAFVVASLTDPAPGSSSWRVALGWGAEASAGDSRQIFKNANSAAVSGDLNSYAGFTSSGTWAATPTVAVHQVTSSSTTLWTAGTAGVSASATPATGSSFADVGRKPGNNTEYWQGPVEEVLVFSKTLTATERRQVEEYLARKWSSPITPQAPTAVAATAGDGQAAVSWTAPSWNGGSVITGYTVTATPTSGTGYGSASTGTCTTSATSCTVSGLTNGITYAVTVAATNAAGPGLSSSTVSVTPYPATVMSTGRLSLWLDGADSSTMFTDASGTVPATTAGDSVMRWNDKSAANGYVSAPASGNAATLTSLAGRLVPRFNGTSSYLSLANVGQLPSGSAASSEIAVASSDEATPAASTYRFVWERGSGSVFAGRAIWKGNGTAQMKADMKGGGVATAGTIGSNAPLVAVAQYASNALTFTTAGATVGTATGAMATGTSYAYVGHNNSSYYWSGPIPEVIVLNTTLTAAEERSVEEYLSRKWGGMITPGAPTGVGATAGDGSVAASWTAGYDGGSAVTGYTATATSSTGGATGSCTVSAPATACTISGLDNGATYTVKVAATNAVGAGPSSAASGAAIPYPATIMTSARMRLWLDAADTSTMFTDMGATSPATTAGQSVARWNDKSGQGGSVQQATAASKPTLATLNGRPVPTFDGTDDWLTLGAVSQLPNGTATSTEILVAADTEANPASNVWRVPWAHGANSTGAGRVFYKQASSAALYADTYSSGIVAGSTLSATPLIAVGQFASAAVDLWTAGRTMGTTSSSFSTGTTFADVGRQSTNTNYWYGPVPEIIVLNTTLSSTERRSIEEYLSRKWGSPIVPSTPTGVAATPADSSAAISWSNGYNGGATATYTATTNTGASCSSVAGTSCTITGLTNGTTYTVTVTPSNSAGTGTASSSVSVTPRTVPGAPTAVTLTPASGQLAVSWTAPASNGGSAVTGYTASTSTGVTCTSASTSCTLTGLTNGTTYTVTVYATNAAGNGAASSGVTGTPGMLANAGFEAGTFTGWSCSANDTIVSSPTHSGTNAAKATYVNPDKARCSQTISGLTGGTTYSFKVWVNGSGIATIGYTAGGNSGSTGNSASGTWTQMSVNVVVPAGTTSATVYFETTGTVTFDDATFS